MKYQTIITPASLVDNLHNPNWLLLDCRGSLASDRTSYQNYIQNHIPNAYFCCFGNNCANTTINFCNDPFFEHEQLVEILSENGYNQDTQIIIYENRNSSYTDSIWLKLRNLGVANVAVLQGGYTAWKEQNLPTTSSCDKAVNINSYAEV